MRIRHNLTRDFESTLNVKVLRAYEGLGKVSACAGIKNSTEDANKARINHHGAIVKQSNGVSFKIPPRQFINVANREPERVQGILDEFINAAKLPKNPFTRTSIGMGDQTLHPFGGSVASQKKIMKKVADEVATMQQEAISSSNFGRGGKKTNAVSTVKRKHSDKPLIDTGDMMFGIVGWVEENG